MTKLSKHQQEVIRLMKEEGYSLQYQNFFPKSGSWYMTVNIKERPGYTNSKSVLKSTAETLLKNKLIALDRIDKHGHKHYKLLGTIND